MLTEVQFISESLLISLHLIDILTLRCKSKIEDIPNKRLINRTFALPRQHVQVSPFPHKACQDYADKRENDGNFNTAGVETAKVFEHFIVQ